jgi:hypothetical protein
MVNALLTSCRIWSLQRSVGWRHVTKLTLQNLDGLAGLAGLADRTGLDTRPTLLRVLTDLYVQKPAHGPEEERHYVELALRLIEVVDAGTCAAVAARLAAYPAAPLAVMARLAKVPGTIAARQAQAGKAFVPDPVSEDDDDLFEPAPLFGTQAAQRAAASASASAEASHQCAGIAPGFIGQRDIFFAADSTERQLILSSLAYVASPDAAPLAQGTNVLRYLEQAALAGRMQEFTTLLQQAIGVSRALSSRIVADERGEPFAVSARALLMPTDMFQRILMFLNPAIGHSATRVYELSDLFATLPLPSALHLVAIWREADRIDAQLHMAQRRPVLYEDSPRAPRRDLLQRIQETGRPADNSAIKRA